MKDPSQTDQALFREISSLKERIRELESSEAEHRRTEEELRTMFDELDATLKAIPDLRFEVDRHGRILSYGTSLQTNLYTAPKSFMGKLVKDVLPAAAAQHIHRAIEEAAKHGSHFGTVYSLPGGGETRWYEMSIAAKGDHTAPDARFVALVRDITDRKRTEDSLRSTESFLNSMIEQGPYPMWISDAKGTLLRISPACKALFRISDEEVVGKYNVFNDNIVAAQGFLPLVKSVFEEGAIAKFKLIYDTSLLSDLPLEKHVSRLLDVTIFPVRDAKGRITNAVIQHIDITDQEKAEEALKASERKYRALAEHMPDFLWHKDRNGVYVSCNRRYADAVGADPESIAGHCDADFYPPDLVAKYLADDRTVMSTGRALETEESWHVKGKVLWLQTRKTALFDETGKCMGTVGIARDITEHKRIEEKRRELEERLQRAEKMEALGLLAGGVAHDLNNALGILVGYAEILHDELGENNPSRLKARNIISGGEQAAAIVQDLLTLARRGIQTKKVVNLNKIVTEYLKSPELMKLKTLFPHVRVRAELDEALLRIFGSQAHVSKTIMNLVSNAAEAMTSGGEVVVRTENRYQDRPVAGYDEVEEGDYAVLTVSDEGEGIGEDDRKRIFEPFYTKKVMGRSGTGLGLAVVWGTMKDHDGYIDVQSEPGRGTTFTLYFPATRSEVENDGEISVDRYMGKGERILVVDDIRAQCDLASSIMQKLNYVAHGVTSGEEAVAYLRENEVDLVILDMIMEPGIDGFETYRRISEIRPKQKAVIVSGYAETERVKAAQSLGAGSFVRKPYIKERIGMAVRRELDKI